MLTRHRITQRASDDGVDATVVERDYVLAHVVAQLHRAVDPGGGQLVFKGGTALRLVHVGDYRYSADLDFSVLNGTKDDAHAALLEVIAAARDHAAFPALELSDDASPMLRYIGPLGAGKPRELKVDIAIDEYVETVEQLGIRPVWDDLPESIPFDVYPLDEIAAEKLRCVIQRVQCRDLFDLFQLVDGLALISLWLRFEVTIHVTSVGSSDSGENWTCSDVKRPAGASRQTTTTSLSSPLDFTCETAQVLRLGGVGVIRTRPEGRCVLPPLDGGAGRGSPCGRR